MDFQSRGAHSGSGISVTDSSAVRIGRYVVQDSADRLNNGSAPRRQNRSTVEGPMTSRIRLSHLFVLFRSAWLLAAVLLSGCATMG